VNDQGRNGIKSKGETTMRNVTTSESSNNNRGLSEEELQRVSGGLVTPWYPYNSADVIDARGGQATMMGLTFTYNIDGKVSSVSPA
jgi:hypothetical protein